MAYSVAVDIGGTFTDLVALDEQTGEVRVEKSSSNANDPIAAVLRVIGKAGVEASDIGLFIHGTTVTTNALLERAGTRVAFVTNRGFRDVIFIQNANRRDLYSLGWKKPRPLASRYDCLEVDCRVDANADVLRPLDDDDVEAVVRHLRDEGITAVAISFLFSYLNPVHELELARRLGDAIPGLTISMSHLVYPRWRENDRGHTTIADAYLKPMFGRYTDNLRHGLQQAGAGADLMVMKSNGGVVNAETAADQPVNYLVSGPVGGVLGGAHFAALAGLDKIMTVDIGGTSCDVSLLVDGEPSRSSSFVLDVGMSICAPQVDIRTIGAGGGSIAWIDAGGLLRVGPQSAGSSPGPACYAGGGTDPTLTDANLLLGRLNAESFAGGDIPLSVDLARQAMEKISGPLGQSVEETCEAIIQLANHNMVNALSVISVERGIDPRDYALVAFGGAGALHTAGIAEIIGSRTVLVPPYPGNISAFGLLTAGLRSDLSTTLLVRSDEAGGCATLNTALMPLRERTLAALQREGFSGTPRVEVKLEMRYFGQNHYREIAVEHELPLSDAGYAAAFEAFHADHRKFYGYEQRSDVIEIVGLTVTAIGERADAIPTLRTSGQPRGSNAKREVYFGGRGWLESKVLQRETLATGERHQGPVIIEERLSTTLVPPDAEFVVHDSGSLVIELAGGAQ
jgi:N-methylhydantoinase A